MHIIIKYVLHRFDLLSKVATKYTASVTDKLSKLESMEQDLNNTARALAQAVDEVNSNARKAQERLERHCSGENCITSLRIATKYYLMTVIPITSM